MATRTIVVVGNGTNQLSYQLDGPDVTEVEAVLAEIDAGGAGDTVATLLATSPAGSDVAAVPQGQSITGGGQGRATWALRLAEDDGGGGGTKPKMEFVSNGGGATACPANSIVEIPLAHQTGAVLLNLGNPFQPHLIAAGTYAFSFNITPAAGFAASAVPWWVVMSTFDTLVQQAQAQSTFATSPVSHVAASVALTRDCAALCAFRLLVTHNETSTRSFFASGIVEKLA